jgi:hypothetical protein
MKRERTGRRKSEALLDQSEGAFDVAAGFLERGVAQCQRSTGILTQRLEGVEGLAHGRTSGQGLGDGVPRTPIFQRRRRPVAGSPVS